MMYHVMIIEDDPMVASINRQYVEATPSFQTDRVFKSGAEALEYLKDHTTDLIILDYYTPLMNGDVFIDRLHAMGKTPAIIMVPSANDTDIVRSLLSRGVLDYLVKPFSYENLTQALSRCSAELLEQSQCVIIPGAAEQPPLLLHQITYTEYQSRNVEVHLLGGKTRLISMRQADFAALLLAYPYFCDCMRGVLVNLEQVESLTASHFLLSDGTSVPVSRLKYKEVREKYLSFAYARMRGGFTNGTL